MALFWARGVIRTGNKRASVKRAKILQFLPKSSTKIWLSKSDPYSAALNRQKGTLTGHFCRQFPTLIVQCLGKYLPQNEPRLSMNGQKYKILVF